MSLALLAASCAAPPPPTDPRVVIVPSAGVVADPPIVAVEGDLLRVSVRLVDPAGADARVMAQTDWFDAMGRPLPSVMSAPQRMVVPALGDAWVRGVAPNGAATGFRLRVEPDVVGNP